MDNDCDNQLKYRDFCNLCAEQVITAPSEGSFLGSTSKASGSEFSKIIKSLKQKKPGMRGGPNFHKKRGSSVGPDSFQAAKNISQMVGNQPFVSSEL